MVEKLDRTRRRGLTVRAATGRLVTAACCALIVAVLVSGCNPVAPSAYVRGASPDHPAAESTIVAEITALPTTAAAWKTYSDATLGYSLSFPEDVEFSCGTSKDGIYTARLQFQIPGVDGYQGMVLRVEPNPEHVRIEALAQDIYRRSVAGESESGSPAATKPVTIAALPGLEVGADGDFSLLIPHGDYVYTIAPVHDFAMTSVDPQALALFYQVLATLEFKR